MLSFKSLVGSPPSLGMSVAGPQLFPIVYLAHFFLEARSLGRGAGIEYTGIVIAFRSEIDLEVLCYNVRLNLSLIVIVIISINMQLKN
jgi:hypothetical protein